MRIEALRFALLIVLTVALASVAFRINSHSHSSSTSSHARTGPMTAPQSSSPSSPQSPSSAAPSSSGQQSSPGQQSSSGQQQPGSGGGAGFGSGGAGSGGSGTVQQLPVTGWDSAMKLGALAFVLIGGGMFSIRSAGPSRPRPMRQGQRPSVQD